jgi:hypothetical protein
MLRKYGYAIDLPAANRQKALSKAVKRYGALSVFRKLNALAVLNKNRNKANAKVYKQDRDFVKSKFMAM